MHISPRPQRCSFPALTVLIVCSNVSFGISLMTDGINVIFGLAAVVLTGFPFLPDSCVVEAEPVDVVELVELQGFGIQLPCLAVGFGSAVDVSVL